MRERDGYIPGVPCWIDTTQPDPEAAADVLRRPVRLGVRGRHAAGLAAAATSSPACAAATWPPSGRLPEGAPPTAVWNTYVWVDSADETAAKVRDAGGTRRSTEPFDVGDAGRMAVFADPEGAAFCVWQAKQHRGARIVNEPGSLNFNDLHTRDLDGAQGVLRRGVRLGGARRSAAASRCGRCPATATSSSSARPGHARAHGRDGRAGAASRTSSRASPDRRRPARHPGALGRHVRRRRRRRDRRARRPSSAARVLVPPFDAPWVRMTVIADPQGATFTASKFVPENRDLPRRRAPPPRSAQADAPCVGRTEGSYSS